MFEKFKKFLSWLTDDNGYSYTASMMNQNNKEECDCNCNRR